jgi:uncharacterized protein YeeX (DUF496 family)
MIESIMLCGIGVLAGCLLMLMFIPLVHERAVRITKQQIVDATPMTVNEIQADKDHLRAEFAMSVRRLEISLEEMRSKATSRYSDMHKQNAEISRLQVELDKKTALIFALRTREEVRKGAVRRVLKILLYFYMRARRLRRPPLFDPVQDAIHQQNAELSRLQVELDKRMAAIFALRAREQVRKGVVRRVVKIVLYFYIRARRRHPQPLFEPVQDAVHQQNAELSRLQVELDKRMAAIFALRAREQVRKGVVRRVVKIVLYFYIRARRRHPQPLFEPVQGLRLRYGQQAERSELAAAAAAVAALNLKRRRAAASKL